MTRTDSLSLGFILACAALATGLAIGFDETKALLPGGALLGLAGHAIWPGLRKH